MSPPAAAPLPVPGTCVERLEAVVDPVEELRLLGPRRRAHAHAALREENVGDDAVRLVVEVQEAPAVDVELRRPYLDEGGMGAKLFEERRDAVERCLLHALGGSGGN